jgi:diadenylate cyclase
LSPLQSLYGDVLFRLSGTTWLDFLDLLLVAVFFYLLLSLVRRSRAAFLLRGVLALGVLLFVVTILLPLPTFDWLVRAILLVMLIATPVIFQPELRRLLERVGRTTGLARALRRTEAEHVLPQVMRAVEKMASTQTGALLVLEGSNSLQAVIETGVPIGGSVTSELIESIFFPGNPLHDGAAVLSPDRTVAAGCVLPLSERILVYQRRLGTRHRAAVGLSETTDALVVVVSEETGEISVANNGRLYRPLDHASLRERLYSHYVPSDNSKPSPPLGRLISQVGEQLWTQASLPSLRQIGYNFGVFVVASLLALVAWWFVIEQTNPAQRARVSNIPLRVESIPANVALVTSPPANVSAIIRTTGNVLDTLSTESFQAVVSLKDLEPGLHHLPVQVNTGAAQVRVEQTEPQALDLELVPIISQTVTVSVDLADQQSLSPAYELVGSPAASPDKVEIVGAAPLIERVSRVQAAIALASASTSIREIRPLRAVDEQGRDVSGISIQPAQVQVTVPIRRRFNARDVGVRAVTQGVPPDGYWLSSLSVTTSSVTLQGSQSQLAEIGGFVDTLPVDVSQATGDLSVQVPLDLPGGVQALDSRGNVIKSITVLARVVPRRGDLAIARPVELIGVRAGLTITLNPETIDLLLSGPLPVLNQIEAEPDLVRVLLDVADLNRGQNISVTPTVLIPDGIRAQPIPPSVRVTVE